MAADETIRIRPYLPADRGQVMALASAGFGEEEVQLTKAIRRGGLFPADDRAVAGRRCWST